VGVECDAIPMPDPAWLKTCGRALGRAAARLRATLPASVQRAAFGLPVAYAESTPKLCRERGWTCVELDPPRPRRHVAPRTIGAAHPAFDALPERAYTSPATFVATIPRGSTLGRTGTSITQDGTLLLDASAHLRLRSPLEHRAFTSYLVAPPRKRLPGRVAVLAAAGAGNYFHWMLEALPRLGLLERAGLRLGDIDRFVVPRCRLAALDESLAMLGIGPERIVRAGKWANIEAEELVVVSLAGGLGYPTGESASFLRERIGGAAPRDRASPARILVERPGRRRFANAEDVRRVAAAAGVVPVQLEGRTLAQQAALFAGAELVVAAHGAALTNLAFCAPGTQVIEIFSPAYVNPCYWALAAQAGLRHSYLVGEGTPVADGTATYADIQVPTDLLGSLLAEHEAA